MAIYVYQSDTFSRDAQISGVTEEQIERQLVKWVEDRQSIACFNRFPSPFLTRKRFVSYNNRVIAAEELIELDGDRHTVIVLLRLVVRGSREYENYSQDSVSIATPWLEKERPKLRDWLRERTREAAVQPLPTPTAEESALLFDIAPASDLNEQMICESREWIQDVQIRGVADRLVNLCGEIRDRILPLLLETPEPVERVHFGRDLHIRFRLFPESGLVLLLRVQLNNEPPPDTHPLETGRLEVIRRTARTYSTILLADDDLWMKLERNEEGSESANLALSPEEAAVLSSARDHSTGGFPMFINGRAGSGKSTVLQYLFAETIRSWLRCCPSADPGRDCPLYLAASGELVRRARLTVRNLLQINSAAITAGENVGREQLELLEPRLYGTVASVLRNTLPIERQHEFEEDRRIGYGRFRELWEQKFGRDRHAIKQYGPQVSWHVIRSFVKGLNVEGCMDSSEDYLETPKDEQNVSTETFVKVFQKVWKEWYLPLMKERGFWDDQDLARAVLEHLDRNPDSGPSHAAIFCDEAQDLTRIEIECLYRLSVFARRTLDRESARRAPFVFAGDPFQTLNPTGFRWEAMKSSFNERLTANLDRFSRSVDAIRINYQELSHNYRSTPLVVRFCNAVQCIRAGLLSTHVRPQASWNIAHDNPPPMFFQIDEALGRNLKQHQDLTIIVPCEEGEEAEYVKSSPFLMELVTWDKSGLVPERVLSAVRAKGLEFKRTMLYGFGEREESVDLARMLSSAKDEVDMARERRLQVEYFLNKLYVGASRAMKRLFIVDQPECFEPGSFWNWLSDPVKVPMLLDRLGQTARMDWNDALTTMVPGNRDAFGQDKEDPGALADAFERDGRSNRNPYLLRQAAAQYRKMGKESVAIKAEAQAAEWEDNHKLAGTLYAEAGDYERAIRAFFDGGLYALVPPIAASSSTLVNRIEARLSGMLTAAGSSHIQFPEIVQELADRVQMNREHILDVFPGRMDSWTRAFSEGLRGCGKGGDSADPKVRTRLRTLVHNIQGLISAGLPGQALKLPLATLADLSGDFESVLDLLADGENQPLARKAHAELILEGRRSSRGSDDDREVARMLRDRGQFVQAAGWYLRGRETANAGRCLCDGIGRGLNSHSKELAEMTIAVFESLLQSQSWRDALAMCESSSLPGHSDLRSREEVRRVFEEHAVIERRLIPFLAQQPIATLNPIASELTGLLRQRIGESPAAFGRWRGKVRVEHIGAALERVNNLVRALIFYEAILDDPATTGAERQFAVQRWLRCKLEQIEVEARRSGEGNRTSHVSKLREDVRKFCTKHRVSESDAGPKNLDVSGVPVDPAAALSSHQDTPPELSELNFQYFPAKGRIVATCDGEVIVVDCSPIRVTFNSAEIEASGSERFSIADLSIDILVTATRVTFIRNGRIKEFLRGLPAS